MGKERPARLLEGLKTAAILLLTFSALFLAGQVFHLSGGESADEQLQLLLSGTAEPSGSGGTSRPVRMAVRNAQGRYGAQYDTTAVDALFDELGDLLGEALGSAGAAVPVGRDAWESALGEEGVYYDFPGRVSLSLLSAWLGKGELTGDVQAECLLLSRGEEGLARLYYYDADRQGYYACNTLTRFGQRLEGYVPNGARFAFEEPERYEGLDPDTLILADTPAPPVYEVSAGVNVEDEQARDSLLDALRVEPQPNSIYPSADGWNVRDGEDTLRLTRGGTVYYHAGEGSDRYHLSTESDRGEIVQAAGELVRQVMNPRCGAARVYLDDVEQEEGQLTLTYRFALSGAEVQLGKEGWCARMVVENGSIREYTLKLRRYEQTDTKAVLLPEYQAMHAMQALDAWGKRLLLCYYDNGSGTVSPAWIAR